jgi:antitoxin PrlF
MSNKDTSECCHKECCKINAIVSVDQKGQIVLPKDLREKAHIKPNDKLAVIAFEKDGEVCCIAMVKADALTTKVKDMLGPVFKNVFQEEEEK